MDLMSILGFVLGTVLMVFGIIVSMPVGGPFKLSPGQLMYFFDPQSVLITFGGVISGLMIAFPVDNFKKIFKHMKIIFHPDKYNPGEVIDNIVELAQQARMKGLLSLEDKLAETNDVFLRDSLMLAVDSIEPEKVKQLLESELGYLDDRHARDRMFYERAAAFGPAFGMLGTLIGLVLMLQDMDDVSKIAGGMATALLTTFYGSILANMIFSPIANKLKVRHEEEFLCKMIVVEGVQAIQAGENPKFIEEKLRKLVPGIGGKKGGDDDEDGGGKGKKGKPKKEKKKKGE
ncbi:MAG: MotA/TolQ/ExbB proton channel family protein [Oscillospiraceae bacterium]